MHKIKESKNYTDFVYGLCDTQNDRGQNRIGFDPIKEIQKM